MTERDAQPIVGAMLTGFYLASNGLLHLKFTQCQAERVLAKPDLLTAQVWFIRPISLIIKLARKRHFLEQVTVESSPNGVTSAWSFGGEEMLSVECDAISHVFLPVVSD